MDRIDEILFLYEDDRVEMKDGGQSGKPLISDSELKKLSKKFTQREIAKKFNISPVTVGRYFRRLGIKSAYQPGGYKGAISEARRELEKKLPEIRKLFLQDKLSVTDIANKLGYTKKQIESVIDALRGKGRGNVTEPERIKLYEKNKITQKDMTTRGRLNPLKTSQSVIDNVVKDSKNFSLTEVAEKNNLTPQTIIKIAKEKNLKFPYRADTMRKVSDHVTKNANKLLSVLKKNPELITNVEKLYEKAGFNKIQGSSAIQALKANTIVSGNIPRFNLSKSDQKLVDKLAAPRISAETEALKAGVKEADIKSGMLRPRVALQEYFAVGDVKKRGTVFEHSFPRSLIPFVKNKKLQQQLMITGERTSPFLNDFKIRFDRLQKFAIEKFLQDGNLTEYNKKINDIRNTVRKATGGYEIGYIKFDKNKNATPVVKAKPITEGVKQFGIETTQKVSGFKNAKYTTNLLKNYVKNPDAPIFNTLKDEVPVEKITPKVIKASEDAAKAYKKAEPFIGNRQKFVNFAKRNLNNSLVNALFKSPYGRAAVITGAVLSPSYLAASEVEAADGTEVTKSILPEVAGGAAAGSLAFKPVRQAVGKGLKATGRLLGKLAVPIGIGAEAYFAKQAYDEGKSIPEIMAAPFLLEGKVRKAQDLLSMSPEERQAVNRASREDFSGLDSDFDTPTLEGVDEVDIEEVLKRVQRKRMADEARRREERKAGGGIAGIRKPDAIPPESGPNPQGLENLKYYVTNT
jgi:transcriptional regulator with XRE-family HTH domain